MFISIEKAKLNHTGVLWVSPPANIEATAILYVEYRSYVAFSSEVDFDAYRFLAEHRCVATARVTVNRYSSKLMSSE